MTGGPVAEARRDERERRARLAVKASVVAYAANGLVLLVTIAVAARHLGSERYGMWLTITSVAALLNVADLGIGNSLLTRVADSDGRDDELRARRAVSNAVFSLSMVMLALTVLVGVISQLLSWPDMLGVRSPAARREADTTVIVVTSLVLVSIPLSVVSRIRAGYQESHYNAAWQVGGSLIAIGSLPIVIWLGGGAPWMAVVLFGAPILAVLGNGIQLVTQRPNIRPRRQDIDARGIKGILGTGTLFFIIQVSGVVTFSTGNLVIANVLGAERVTEYGVAARLFATAQGIVALGFLPMWPAYREAMARSDYDWIRRTLQSTVRWAAYASATIAVAGVAVGGPLIEFWAGPQARPSLFVLVWLAVWLVMGSVGSAIAMFLNGCEVIGRQVVFGVLMAIVNLPLSIWLAREIGVAGPILATVVSYAVLVIVPVWGAAPRALANLESGALSSKAIAYS